MTGAQSFPFLSPLPKELNTDNIIHTIWIPRVYWKVLE